MRDFAEMFEAGLIVIPAADFEEVACAIMCPSLELELGKKWLWQHFLMHFPLHLI